MTQKEAETSGSVASGTLIAKNPAFALFDTGASHSFVSSSFVRKSGISYIVLKEALCVDTPMGYLVLSDRLCRLCSG